MRAALLLALISSAALGAPPGRGLDRGCDVSSRRSSRGTVAACSSAYPPAPPMPTPPSSLFYLAPTGGFGMGAQECTGQKIVDVNQNAINAGQTANETCDRISDGLRVELSSSVARDLGPAVLQLPGHANVHRGVRGEGAGTNRLFSTETLNDNDGGTRTWTPTGAVVEADVWSGPASHYRSTAGFERITDDQAGSSERLCQTYSATTQTAYAFTCWLRAGTLTTARLSIAGTGNTAGDTTCNITGLDTTLSYSDRKGCVSGAYGAGITAVTVCILPGAADSDTGTIGAVDCQLERQGHATSYIRNQSAENTRAASNANFPVNPATLTLSNSTGSVGTELWVEGLGSPTFWTNITVSDGTSRGPYYSSATAARCSDAASNAPNKAVANILDATVAASCGWTSGGNITIWVADAGAEATASYGGTMFGTTIAAGSMKVEGNTASQDGVVANVCFGATATECRTQATMANITRIGVVGDSIAVGTGLATPWPAGVFTAESVNGSNFAVVGQKFSSGAPTPCTTQWAQNGNGTYDTVFLACGTNDLVLGASDAGVGTELFNDEKAWVQEWAYRGLKVYWLDILPFKNYSGSDAAKVQGRTNWTSLWTSYCGSFTGNRAAPETNVVCCRTSTSMALPGDSDALNYTTDGLHPTQAGATVMTSVVTGCYP